MSELFYKPFSQNDIESVLTSALAEIRSSALTADNISQTREAALNAFQAYGHRDASFRPLPPTNPQEENPYQQALKAFELLSKPTPKVDEAVELEIQAAEKLLRNFTIAVNINSSNLLFTDAEYAAMKAGQFENLDNAWAQAEQRLRHKVNASIKHSLSSDVKFHYPYKYKVVHDPVRLSKIEDIMRMDTTSNWILDTLHQNEVPTLLFEYIFPPETPGAVLLPFGTYVIDTRCSPLLEYIELFINSGSDLDIASTYAHEGRHFQQTSVLPVHVIAHLSPIDKVIMHLLREADAHAIHSKINRGFSKKIGTPTILRNFTDEFANAFDNLETMGLSPAVKTKRATQAVFLSFLRQEFSNPLYLNKCIETYMEQIDNPGQWVRTIPESFLLKADFLQHLTQVGTNLSYLNEDGVRQTQKLFFEQFPLAIMQHKRGGDPRLTPI